MSTWAKPGVKCVCVRKCMDASGRYAMPQMGQIYTVRDTELGTGWYRHHGVFIRLEEIKNAPHFSDGIEPSFQAGFFRPLVTRTQEQDLEQFIPLLSTKPHEVDA